MKHILLLTLLFPHVLSAQLGSPPTSSEYYDLMEAKTQSRIKWIDLTTCKPKGLVAKTRALVDAYDFWWSVIAAMDSLLARHDYLIRECRVVLKGEKRTNCVKEVNSTLAAIRSCYVHAESEWEKSWD